MSNELRPYVPTHPGNVLKDEMQARSYAYLLKSSVIALSDKLRLIVYEKKMILIGIAIRNTIGVSLKVPIYSMN
ncbi:MAG: hypothetical protein LRY59_06995 [Bacteroides graminisolvens]|nr:hypothetical protein [Bacteroides graminisolvens]